jgi:hypothetical protein
MQKWGMSGLFRHPLNPAARLPTMSSAQHHFLDHMVDVAPEEAKGQQHIYSSSNMLPFKQTCISTIPQKQGEAWCMDDSGHTWTFSASFTPSNMAAHHVKRSASVSGSGGWPSSAMCRSTAVRTGLEADSAFLVISDASLRTSSDNFCMCITRNIYTMCDMH